MGVCCFDVATQQSLVKRIMSSKRTGTASSRVLRKQCLHFNTVWSWQLFYKHFTLQVKNNTLSCHSAHTWSGFIFSHLGPLSRKSHLSTTVFFIEIPSINIVYYNISGFNQCGRLCALSAYEGWIFGLWLSAHPFPSKISTSHFHSFLGGFWGGWQGDKQSRKAKSSSWKHNKLSLLQM